MMPILFLFRFIDITIYILMTIPILAVNLLFSWKSYLIYIVISINFPSIRTYKL